MVRQVSILRGLIRRVLEGNGDGTNDNGQNLACRGTAGLPARYRHRCFDGTGDNQNGRDDRSKGGIRRNGRTDVHPAQGDHFQGTTDNNTGFHIPENGANQRTGHQRTVELKFIKYRLHTRNTRDDEHQHNLKKGNLHCTSPVD